MKTDKQILKSYGAICLSSHAWSVVDQSGKDVGGKYYIRDEDKAMTTMLSYIKSRVEHVVLLIEDE